MPCSPASLLASCHASSSTWHTDLSSGCCQFVSHRCTLVYPRPLVRVLELLQVRGLQLDLAVDASRQSLIPEVLERGRERPQPAEHFFQMRSPLRACVRRRSRSGGAYHARRLCSPSLLSRLAAGRSCAQDARNDTSQNAHTDIDSLVCKLADAKTLLDPEEIRPSWLKPLWS